jgi:L-cystine transport system permease protein
MGDFFSLERAIEAFPKVLKALPVTLEIVVISILAGLLLGIILCLIRLTHIPVLTQIASVYISFMRGTPIIVQLYLVYYGLPILAGNLFGVNIGGWNKLIFIIAAFALNEAAFLCEIIRGSILAVPKQQTEAGYTVGMTYFQTFVHVIIPQAIRVATPSFGLDLISLFQGTSLAFLLGAVDVIGRARTIGANSGHLLDVYADVAIIFVSISILLEFVFNKAQKKGDAIYGKI